MSRRALLPIATALFVMSCNVSWFGRAVSWFARADVEWEESTPEAEGMSRASLSAFRDSLAHRRTTALVVARHGRIVLESYPDGLGPNNRHHTASLAKALVGGMGLLSLLNDGLLQLDSRASTYIPSWRSDSLKSRITIRHLATHSSGLEDAEEPGKRHDQLEGWKDAFWRQDPDPFIHAIQSAPVLFEPGSSYAYSSVGFAALSYVLAAALRGSDTRDIRRRLNTRIMRPIGIPAGAWTIGYQSTYTRDGLRLVASHGGGTFTARAAARVGQLMLEQGQWAGNTVVSAASVDSVTRYGNTPKPERLFDRTPASAAGWYVNSDGVWPNVPRDAFVGAGYGHQLLLVIPSLGLVAARFGWHLNHPSEDIGFWAATEKYFLDPLIDGVEEPPYAPSATIRRVTFAPEPTVVRLATGSDNWPITWADDSTQYTSYGDGWGFEPRVPDKLSLGFARIVGGPRGFRGENVRAQSGERFGDGENGPKASGILAVGDTLYAWVRNTQNAQVIESADLGQSWHWGFRFDTTFGAPTFLQFGPAYSGARDDYVYVYSHDGPSAYEAADGLVLARVPRDRIMERDAYEFFHGLEEGEPKWTTDLAKRSQVLTYPGRILRTDAVYHPDLERYLIAVGFDFSGGWALFDAPEPWGPWTTAYYTFQWGLGDTHGYRIPVAWLESDSGRLVFSGLSGRGGINYDAFSVRGMKIEPWNRNE